jgi:carboxyl-terminal processing protease
MLRNFFLLFLLIFSFFLEAGLPNLTAKSVQKKINEILKAHINHKEINNEIAQRIINNILDELDPSKTYLLEDDIKPWLNPSNELLSNISLSFSNIDFSGLKKIHEEMIKAIHRRRKLEKETNNTELPKGIDPKELKDMKWAKTEEELIQRNLKIKAMQLEVAEKFNEETKQQIINRMEKRKLHRENELLGENEEEKMKSLLCLIMKATTSALDAHTNYFTPAEANQFMIQVQQRLFGIGAQLKDNLNGFSIVRIIEGGPASINNKLKINDLIIAVNNEPVVGMDIIEAVELIRGKKGTPITLTVLRESTNENIKQVEKLDIKLIRGEVVLEESRFEKNYEPFADGAIGYIRLFSFYQDPKSSSGEDIKKAIEDLKQKNNLKGIILDLRNNAGGLLPQAVAVTGLFITKGIVVSIKDNNNKIQHLRDIGGKMTWDGPLIVLTNRASASAAEIVTQTLQDYGRAIVVGDDKTFGKGSFQTFTLDTNLNKINPEGEYKVTRGMYYTVSGKSPQLKGVKADIEIPGILSEIDIGEEFSKYPLANESIDEHFEDDLSDIPPIHKKRIALLYNHNLQCKLSIYTQYLDALKKNSKKRLEENKNYQNFLTEIQNKRFETQPVEFFGQSDLQLTEAYNIMKDFIFLAEFNDKYAPSY